MCLVVRVCLNLRFFALQFIFVKKPNALLLVRCKWSCCVKINCKMYTRLVVTVLETTADLSIPSQTMSRCCAYCHGKGCDIFVASVLESPVGFSSSMTISVRIIKCDYYEEGSIMGFCEQTSNLNISLNKHCKNILCTSVAMKCVSNFVQL